MSSFYFRLTGNQSSQQAKDFVVKGPAGMTEAEAKKIFDSQVLAGSLVGFQTGNTLTAASQAAAGLGTAQASVAQALSTKAPDLTAFTSGLQTSPNVSAKLNDAVGRNVVSLESRRIAIIENIAIQINSTPVGNTITVSDYARSVPATITVGTLTTAEITATMAAVEKLSGQAASEITNTVGIGKYGFSCLQLERAGYIKAGTAAKYLAQNANELTTIAQSYAVWTGKNDIFTLEQLLGNTDLQSVIQQQLMNQGLLELQQLGIDGLYLEPQYQSALAANAAVDVADTYAWATNQPLSSQSLASFNQRARNVSYAVDLTKNKLNNSLLRQTPEPGTVQTVNSLTVNAAAIRIVGNDKVPSPVPQSVTASKTSVEQVNQLYVDYKNNLQTIANLLIAGEISGSLTYQQYDSYRNKYQTLTNNFDQKYSQLLEVATALVAAETFFDLQQKLQTQLSTIQQNVVDLEQLKTSILKLLAKLSAAAKNTLV